MLRALAIDEASLGAEHPSVARDLNNLALLLQATNRLAEAASLMRRALSITEGSLGADHPSTGLLRRNFGRMLQDLSQTEEAERQHRRAVVILAGLVRQIGRAHPDHDDAVDDYRALLAALGHDAAAIDAAIEAAHREAGLL